MTKLTDGWEKGEERGEGKRRNRVPGVAEFFFVGKMGNDPALGPCGANCG